MRIQHPRGPADLADDAGRGAGAGTGTGIGIGIGIGPVAGPRTGTGEEPLTDDARALVTEHLPLVGYLVAEVLPRLPGHVQRDDLVSAGQLALVKAARSYDRSTGVPFASYARMRIRGGLTDELRAADWASRGVRSRARELHSAHDRLAGELGRFPSDQELAAELATDVAAMRATRTDLHRSVVLSLDQLVEVNGSSDGHVDPSTHHVDASQHLMHTERLTYLLAAVSALPERMRVVVEEYFLADKPMADIAAQLGVSESRVSQLRAEAVMLLRDGINAHLDPAQVTPVQRPEGVVAKRRTAYYAQVAAYAATATSSGAAALPTGPRRAPAEVTRSA